MKILGIFNFLALALLLTGANQRATIPTPCEDAQVLAWNDTTKTWDCTTPASGGVPSGAILIVNTGACPAGYTEVAGMDGKTILGTLNANGNVGGTGGSDAITPEGTNSGGAVSAHSGTAVADHASHTHTYTDVVNHTHGFTDVRGNTSGGVTTAHGFTEGNDTSSTLTSTVTGNPSGGVATGTTNGPSATLTHNVTQPSAHTFTQPTFSGTQFDNRSAFVRCIFCKKD